MEDNFGDDHAQSTSKEVSSIAGPALATSSRPSDSGPGNGKMEEPKKEEEVPNSKVTTNGMLMNSRPKNEPIYGRLNLLKEPIMARLEELTSMDPTVEVALEIADSLDLLNFMKCRNQDMEKAGNWARSGARELREGAKLVAQSQQILRSAILNDQNPSSTHLPHKGKFDYPLPFHLQATGMVVINGRPTNEGIYGDLKVPKEPVMARLEVLMSMDSTVEVGLEIADSVHLLCLINSANHEMAKACEGAGRGVSRMTVGAQFITKSQQILRSATLNEQEYDEDDFEDDFDDDFEDDDEFQALPVPKVGAVKLVEAAPESAEPPLQYCGIYASIKSQLARLASVKGAMTPGSSTARETNAEASQGSSTTQVADAGASSSHATPGS